MKRTLSCFEIKLMLLKKKRCHLLRFSTNLMKILKYLPVISFHVKTVLAFSMGFIKDAAHATKPVLLAEALFLLRIFIIIHSDTFVRFFVRIFVMFFMNNNVKSFKKLKKFIFCNFKVKLNNM